MLIANLSFGSFKESLVLMMMAMIMVTKMQMVLVSKR